VDAGFDGVQIHAAHGYLLSAFLTPSANARTDAYGGDAAGRRRLLLEVAARVREAVGPDRALLCKFGAVDGRDNSLPIEETVETAQALARAGVDALEVSCTFGGPHAQPSAEGIDAPGKEAYFARHARAIRAAVRIPVILVGGLRSLDVMEQAVAGGVCDFVALSRPFIREPDLVNAFREGRARRAACVSCNRCYDPRGFRCVFL
jgi:2,4-dienoyl-CoA reductase-like NADH-dependent reductase (Old Yellow Enzyme family)